jgi:hypothetical protein
LRRRLSKIFPLTPAHPDNSLVIPMRRYTVTSAIAELWQTHKQSKTPRSPFVFIVGAGISAPAIWLAPKIVDECRRFVAANRIPVQPTKAKSLVKQYPFWLSAAYPNKDMQAEFFRVLIEDGKMSLANLQLAHILMESDIARVVITPNFDDYLTRALRLFGQRRFKVCDHPAATYRITASSPDIQIVHVHGAYPHYDLVNSPVEASLWRRPLLEKIDTLLNLLLHNATILVIGYSGWDGDVITTALNRYLADPRQGKLFWFSYHRLETKSIPEVLAAHKERDDVVLVEPEKNMSLPAEQIFGELIRKFDVPVPKLLKDPVFFFARQLQSFLPAVGGKSWSGPYSFESALSRIRTAAAHESPLHVLNMISSIRDAMISGKYEEAFQYLDDIPLNQLSLADCKEMRELIKFARSRTGVVASVRAEHVLNQVERLIEHQEIQSRNYDTDLQSFEE